MMLPSPATEFLSKEAIEQLKGKYDEDGFYLLDEGGFYDPCGAYFDKDGRDAHYGFYDDSGVYVKVPERIGKDGISMQKPASKS